MHEQHALPARAHLRPRVLLLVWHGVVWVLWPWVLLVVWHGVEGMCARSVWDRLPARTFKGGPWGVRG